MLWQLGILGTISVFAFRHKETENNIVLELLVLHAFQAFFISNVLQFLKTGPVFVLQRLFRLLSV